MVDSRAYQGNVGTVGSDDDYSSSSYEREEDGIMTICIIFVSNHQRLLISSLVLASPTLCYNNSHNVESESHLLDYNLCHLSDFNPKQELNLYEMISLNII